MEKKPVILSKENEMEILYKRPYLAFLDILGFSTLVRKNSHSALENLYDKIFTETVQKVDQMMKNIRESRTAKQGEDYHDSKIKIINISDSIVMWTDHGHPSALFEIVFATATLMGISLIQGLPLRGCITQQEFSVKEKENVTSIIGRGLVHAYNTEKIQAWSGCVVDEDIIRYFRSIEKVIRQWERPAPIERDHMVYEYDIPISRDGKHTTHKGYAVNWSYPMITDKMIRESFDAHNKKDERPDSDTPTKVENTIKFHSFCLEAEKERQEAAKKLQEALDQADKEGKSKKID